MTCCHSIYAIIQSFGFLFIILSLSSGVKRLDKVLHSTSSLIMVHAYSYGESVRPGQKYQVIGSLDRCRQVVERAAAVVAQKSNSRPKSIASKANTSKNIPKRPLAPPFPDGLNGGRIVTLPPSEHYLLDKDQSGDSQLLPPRDVDVWLPPDYDLHPNMNFPVLYVHDGQNAIKDSSSWTGSSWRLAGALTRLSERKLLTRTTETNSPPIVVLIPSCDDKIFFVSRRHLEYGDISQTFAQAHADFVAYTLKPLIDAKFRTVSGKEGTATIGSSLGGQASLHLCLRHPDIFSAAACLSPAFQAGALTSVTILPQLAFVGKSIYLDNGGDEEDVKVPLIDLLDHATKEHWWNPGYWWLDSQLQVSIDAMKFALDARGVKYKYKKIAGGRHNERAWASRIHEPLLFLYGDNS